MSVLVFIDQAEGHVKKSAAEVLSYGAAVAQQLGVAVNGVVLGNVSDDLSTYGKYGAQKIYQIKDANLDQFDAQVYTQAIAGAVESTGATVVIFSNNIDGKAIAPRLSAKLKAGLVTGAVSLPDTSNGFTVKKSVFSGKAFANISVNSAIKIISLNPNAHKVSENPSATAVLETLSVNIPAAKVKVTGVNKVEGDVPLTEADIVVSGGRGLKGPENWHLIEDLAKTLGAATACSRPVADEHWRPHHEHVGQTGVVVAPNLYIAIGISGAIQHLAGVNRSKVIVVVNKDPEAPFFKAADYGIVGDAFEVVPKLIEAFKNR